MDANKTTLAELVAEAWRNAGVALAVRIEAPFTLKTEGSHYSCVGWVADFGSPQGTILLLDSGSGLESDAWRAARQAGYFVSSLNGDIYRTYEHGVFVETLRDWGYFGEPKREPSWLKTAT
jgi:hypothetical protein